MCAIFTPYKTYAPLIIHPNAVLTLAITLESLEFVAGRNPQAIEDCCSMELQQLSPCDSLDAFEPPYWPTMEKRLGFRALKRMDHG